MKLWRCIIWVLAAVLLMAGCTREAVPEQEHGLGDLRLSLNRLQAGIETKAGTPQEGYAFHNLLVVLTDDHGKVIDKVYKEYPYTPGEEDIQTAAGTLPAEDVIYFRSLEIGTYHAYAYANIDHTDWQDGTIAANEKLVQTAKADNASVTLNTDRILKAFSDGTAPQLPASDPMLLTGQVTVPVGVSVNEASIDLLRPVVKFNVRVNNHTPYAVKVKDLQFSPFNASKTFLLDHSSQAGEPGVPDDAQYIDLPAFTSEVTVPTGGDDEGELVYSTLLYENIASAYKLYMKVEMQDAVNNYPVRELGGSGRSARLIPPDEIKAMQAGDTKTVLLVNPQYNSNGRVIGWNGSSIMFKKVSNIKEAPDYQVWIDNALTESGIESYILTLKRLDDGSFQLFAGTKNLFDSLPYLQSSGNKALVGTTGTRMMMEAKKDVDASRTWNQIGSGFYPYIIRFYYSASAETENKKAYLWNENGAALKTYANNTHQARQWVLYEVGSAKDGVPMKYIEKGTNEVKTLTHMSRNQEFNVILNVFYVNFDTQFDFMVENTWWTDEGGHQSDHTFN